MDRRAGAVVLVNQRVQHLAHSATTAERTRPLRLDLVDAWRPVEWPASLMSDREHDDLISCYRDHQLVWEAREQKAAKIEHNVVRHRADRVAALRKLASSRELLAIRRRRMPERAKGRPLLCTSTWPLAARAWLQATLGRAGATTMVGRDGATAYALPIARLAEIMQKYGRPLAAPQAAAPLQSSPSPTMSSSSRPK